MEHAWRSLQPLWDQLLLSAKEVNAILTLIYTAAGCIIAFQLSMLWQIRNDLNQILQTQRFIYALWIGGALERPGRR
jgi:hypothetical protein